ncbi:MAG TPA: helix-turn-helix transcriptional regulator [Candidatus Polarisedimenticolia bacterium]|nr:helix-turn-helix transcriptional regulator [Candidatus Polarisedimenticolia bacterium]
MTPVRVEQDGPRAVYRAAPQNCPPAAAAPRSPGSLRQELGRALPSGAVSVRFAAGLCGVSVRTLQRHLARAGVTYSDLLEDLRRDLALRLVRDPARKLIDIGQELGYDDPAHFTRAFRRWTGTAPRTYRELCLKPPDPRP